MPPNFDVVQPHRVMIYRRTTPSIWTYRHFINVCTQSRTESSLSNHDICMQALEECIDKRVINQAGQYLVSIHEDNVFHAMYEFTIEEVPQPRLRIVEAS